MPPASRSVDRTACDREDFHSRSRVLWRWRRVEWRAGNGRVRDRDQPVFRPAPLYVALRIAPEFPVRVEGDRVRCARFGQGQAVEAPLRRAVRRVVDAPDRDQRRITRAELLAQQVVEPNPGGPAADRPVVWVVDGRASVAPGRQVGVVPCPVARLADRVVIIGDGIDCAQIEGRRSDSRRWPCARRWAGCRCRPAAIRLPAPAHGGYRRCPAAWSSSSRGRSAHPLLLLDRGAHEGILRQQQHAQAPGCLWIVGW
jgi:hypothetical protein